ncbi:hypothetical protein RBU49_10350 [Clostridium sp. MB40-C1]|uniref:hypothetical protein n=1 Tax=Clostridium sp. MB40-C1 TaxID=3070996 RepID=UPI0027E17015|nr:hypothetical protein [Clostridium sp. MB40-C1]WMJ79290.1 hypothetical protein RBU49_10350 [Clostridium sp. MB40-C1]
MSNITSFIDSSKRMYGFIDERGNYELDVDKKDTSYYFIITALLVDENNLDYLENEMSKISKEFLKDGETKLVKSLNSYPNRVMMLNKIKDLEFKVFSVIVDKRKIFESSGLKHKKSFLKFLNGLLYNEIHNYFPKLQIIAKEDENKEFIEEFKNYILKNHIPNLLGEYEFGFSNNKSENLVQLSEFICEIIGAGYEEGFNSYELNDYMNILQDKLLPTVIWPQELEDYIKKLEQYKTDDYDENIAYNSIKLSIKFIKNNKNSNHIEKQEQVYVLKYLLSMLISQKSNEYVSSRDIINNLCEITGREYNPQYFKTKIIAKLRDAGIIISSSQNGYKIPIKEKEILAFVNQTSSMIKPMLERLRICRNRVLSATDNEFDVLNFQEYKYLKEFYDKAML